MGEVNFAQIRRECGIDDWSDEAILVFEEAERLAAKIERLRGRAPTCGDHLGGIKDVGCVVCENDRLDIQVERLRAENEQLRAVKEIDLVETLEREVGRLQAENGLHRERFTQLRSLLDDALEELDTCIRLGEITHGYPDLLVEAVATMCDEVLGKQGPEASRDRAGTEGG